MEERKRKSKSRSRSRDRKHQEQKDKKDKKEQKHRHRSESSQQKKKKQSKVSRSKSNDQPKPGSSQTQLKQWDQNDDFLSEIMTSQNGNNFNIFSGSNPKNKPDLTQYNTIDPVMIEVVVNDRMGKKQRVKAKPSDTVGVFQKLIALKTGTRADKIKLQRAHQVLKDGITLQDYEIKDGCGIEMYYN